LSQKSSTCKQNRQKQEVAKSCFKATWTENK
jgi:hypothetical protein